MDARQAIINALTAKADIVKPGLGMGSFNTPLGDQEGPFRQWAHDNQVPFDTNAAVSDYDMRGFYKGLTSGDPHAVTGIDPGDRKLHYTDWWKTPLHETFSTDSQFAMPNAPAWNRQGRLIDEHGNVVYDAEPTPQISITGR